MRAVCTVCVWPPIAEQFQCDIYPSLNYIQFLFFFLKSLSACDSSIIFEKRKWLAEGQWRIIEQNLIRLRSSLWVSNCGKSLNFDWGNFFNMLGGFWTKIRFGWPLCHFSKLLIHRCMIYTVLCTSIAVSITVYTERLMEWRNEFPLKQEWFLKSRATAIHVAVKKWNETH